jgi:lysophospholipase L1-like esterase
MTGQESSAVVSSGDRYVAMGSSFAAAPGIGHRVAGSPRAAGRSSGNYAHLVARRLNLNLDDVTFSGATTHDILTATASGRPAQVDAVTGPTRLVTITGGGNDVGYAPRILLSSLPRVVRAIPSVRRRMDSFAEQDLMEQRFETLRENLLEIAAQVQRRAPGCNLIFVDYLTVLPPDAATPTGVLPADVAEWAGAWPAGFRGHAGRGGTERKHLRASVSGEHRSPRMVRRAMDTAIPSHPARRSAVPSQRGWHGRRRGPGRQRCPAATQLIQFGRQPCSAATPRSA